MTERNSKEDPELHARLSKADYAFLMTVKEAGGVNKTDVVKGLFHIGRALGPSAMLGVIEKMRSCAEERGL